MYYYTKNLFHVKFAEPNFRLLRVIGLFFLLLSIQQVNAQKRNSKNNNNNSSLKSYGMVKPSDEVQKLFLDAIKANDTAKVRLLLSNGASANYCAYGSESGGSFAIGEKPCVYGYSNYNPNFHWAHPLLYAICSDAKDVINFLLEFEPRLINSQCLHAAIFKNDTALFNFFLEKGANPNLYGNELVQKFRNEGYHGMAPYMAYKYWWNSHAVFSGTPIDYALSSGRMQFVEKLIQMGASISQQKKDDLLMSNSCGNVSLCKYLLSIGANPNTFVPANEYKGIFNAKGPLINAARCKNNELQKMLIESGANVNWSDGYHTPLHIAVKQPNNLDFIKYLVSKGADVNAKVKESVISGPPSISILKACRPEYKETLILSGAR